MKLGTFRQSLWRRYLLATLAPKTILSFVTLTIVAYIDWYFRLAVVWRLFTLISLLVFVVWSYLEARRRNSPPTEEEAFYFAAQLSGRPELDCHSNDLEIPKSSLQPINFWPWIVPFAVLCLCLSTVQGRTGLSRMVLLRGEWPKRTVIANVVTPQIIEFGSPLAISFRTEGVIPRVVRLKINGSSKPLVGAGDEKWNYDFFPEVGMVNLEIEAGDDVVSDLLIEVLPSPVLISSEIIVTQPSYLGGTISTFSGMQASVAEGSDVRIRARFSGSKGLRDQQENDLEVSEGWIEIPITAMKESSTISVQGRADKRLPWHDIAEWKLRLVRDSNPVVKIIEPEIFPWLLRTSGINMTFTCEDDHGLKRFQIKDGEAILFETPLKGRYEEISYHLDIAAHKIESGALASLNVQISDLTGQWSDTLPIELNIVDLETFRQRLLEHQQVMHRNLEELLSSVSRRVKRHQKSSSLEANAEINSLKDDLRRIKKLADLWGQYVGYLRQLEGMEKSITSNRRFRDWFAGPLLQIFENELISEGMDVESQIQIKKKLEDISRDLSRSQDFHLVLRLLDEMIEKQREVVTGIQTP